MNNVLDFGAVGDGVTKDTSAVQRAINAGGIVHFPAGTYLCGTLYLKSGGGLDLAPGAVLLASPDKEDYNADDFCPQNQVFTSESVSGAHFITAVEQHDIVIRGEGRIDGNRKAFYTPPEERSDIWKKPITWRPGQMIFFCECEHVTLENVSLFNAPYWTCFLHGCEHVTVHALHIYNHPFTRNGDGLDIDCCRFVTVSDCEIDVGDDCITLRGNVAPLKNNRSCEYITITNCILRTICNAFRIGVGNGIVRAAMISNCVIFDSRNAITLCSKYSPRKGVLIEDIQFDNIRIEAQKAFAVLSNAHGDAEGPALAPIRNIAFSNIRATADTGSVLSGYALGDVSGLSFHNVEITQCGGDSIMEGDNFAENSNVSAPAAFWCRNINNLTMNSVKVHYTENAHGWKNDVILRNVSNFSEENCFFGKGVKK